MVRMRSLKLALVAVFVTTYLLQCTLAKRCRGRRYHCRHPFSSILLSRKLSKLRFKDSVRCDVQCGNALTGYLVRNRVCIREKDATYTKKSFKSCEMRCKIAVDESNFDEGIPEETKLPLKLVEHCCPVCPLCPYHLPCVCPLPRVSPC